MSSLGAVHANDTKTGSTGHKEFLSSIKHYVLHSKRNKVIKYYYDISRGLHTVQEAHGAVTGEYKSPIMRKISQQNITRNETNLSQDYDYRGRSLTL